MAIKKSEMKINRDLIATKIYYIRGHKVMLDQDLAELYAVETKQLKRQVKRNIDRFPDDFMFYLTRDELNDLRCQIGTSSWGGSRYLPMAFTEQGVSMLSSVLNSKRAIMVNIQIIRTFIKMREMLSNYTELKSEIEKLEKKYDKHFRIVFETIKKIISKPEMAEVKGFRDK